MARKCSNNIKSPNHEKIMQNKHDKVSDKTIDATIKAMREDFTSIKGFIAGELVKVTTENGGIIDIEQEDFRVAAESLINADPKIINSPENVKKRGANSAVLSFTGTKQGIEEKIDKLIKKGAHEEKFTSLREDLNQLEIQLRKQVSTNEGIQELVNKKVARNLISSRTAFKIEDKNNTRFMNMAENLTLINKILEHVKFDNSVINYLLTTSPPKIKDSINKTTKIMISEALGKKEGNSYILDESKLTPEHITKLGNRINNQIAKTSANIDIIKDSLTTLEKDNNKKVTSSKRDEMIDTLQPVLEKLDPEYLKKNRNAIVEELSKKIYAKKTFGTYFFKEFNISTASKENLANDFLKQHLVKSDQFVTDKVTKQFSSQLLTNSKIAERLNNFATENNLEKKYNGKDIPTNAEIAQIRKKNPVEFDQIMGTKPKEVLKETTNTKYGKEASRFPDFLKELRAKMQKHEVTTSNNQKAPRAPNTESRKSR
jgi:hypothetical protein